MEDDDLFFGGTVPPPVSSVPAVIKSKGPVRARRPGLAKPKAVANASTIVHDHTSATTPSPVVSRAATPQPPSTQPQATQPSQSATPHRPSPQPHLKGRFGAQRRKAAKARPAPPAPPSPPHGSLTTTTSAPRRSARRRFTQDGPATSTSDAHGGHATTHPPPGVSTPAASLSSDPIMPFAATPNPPAQEASTTQDDAMDMDDDVLHTPLPMPPPPRRRPRRPAAVQDTPSQPAETEEATGPAECTALVVVEGGSQQEGGGQQGLKARRPKRPKLADQSYDKGTMALKDMIRVISARERRARALEARSREAQQATTEVTASEEGGPTRSTMSARSARAPPRALGMGPQVRINEAGQVVVAEGTLEVQAGQVNHDGYTRVDEDQRLINSFTYMKKADAVRWTIEETNQFYNALRTFGTDFTLIAQLFPKRGRRGVKAKYLKEERTNPKRMEEVLKYNERNFNHDDFHMVLEGLARERGAEVPEDITSPEVQQAVSEGPTPSELEAEGAGVVRRGGSGGGRRRRGDGPRAWGRRERAARHVPEEEVQQEVVVPEPEVVVQQEVRGVYEPEEEVYAY